MKQIAILNTRKTSVRAASRNRPGATIGYLGGLLLLVAALLGTAPAAQAQDPGFSQFFASPLSLNPALTGKFNGVVRIAGNYRNQWPSINNAFITSTVSVDAPILRNKLPENDTWGIGLMAMTDKTGRTELRCLKCDQIDPMKTVAVKWADGPLAAPE